jgi:hypothetical protein
MRLHFGLSLALVLGTFGVAQAQPPYPYPPNAYPPGAHRPAPRVFPGEEAAEVLRQGMDKLLDFLGRKEKPNRLQVAAFLDREIAPYFDFGYMARWVAGARYGAISACTGRRPAGRSMTWLRTGGAPWPTTVPSSTVQGSEALLRPLGADRADARRAPQAVLGLWRQSRAALLRGESPNPPRGPPGPGRQG